MLKDETNARLLLVGGGPLRKQLETQAADLGISDKTLFVGAVERREVFEYLDAMDVFVLPSLVEGLSEALVQAMCFALPVIVSDIPQNREVVKDEENGLVFPVGNAVALAKSLARLYRNPNLREKMGQQCRQIVVERFDIYQIVEQYHQFYSDLLERRRRCA